MISKNPNYKLIHSTKEENLKELKPTWKSNDGRFYDSSRVYFSYIPVDRGGNKISNKTHNLYTPVYNYTRIFADTDLPNFRKIGACYIETTNNIEVKQINDDSEV